MNKGKAMAEEFIKKYSFYEPNLSRIKDIIESQGYTIIKFNAIDNEEDVERILESLKLTPYIAKTRAFTFVNEDYRLVFVNEDLSVDETFQVLLHEEGHIFCEHFSQLNVIGNDVTHEQEANEFAHYCVNLSLKSRFYKKRKTVAAAAVATAVLSGGVAGGNYAIKEMSYYGEYYVTETGYKYHTEDCGYVKSKTNVRRLTDEDFESGKYSPCEKCIDE